MNQIITEKNLHSTFLIRAENQALRPPDLISSHNIHRLGECHLLCIERENCHGYNYRVRPGSVYSVNCQLSKRTKKWNKTTTEFGPWVYYEDVEVQQTSRDVPVERDVKGKNTKWKQHLRHQTIIRMRLLHSPHNGPLYKLIRKKSTKLIFWITCIFQKRLWLILLIFNSGHKG